MLAGLGVVLIVVGAVMRYAINVDGRNTEGFDVRMIGLIVMVGGGLTLAVAAIQGLGWMSSKNSHVRSERSVGDNGRTVIEDTKVS